MIVLNQCRVDSENIQVGWLIYNKRVSINLRNGVNKKGK